MFHLYFLYGLYLFFLVVGGSFSSNIAVVFEVSYFVFFFHNFNYSSNKISMSADQRFFGSKVGLRQAVKKARSGAVKHKRRRRRVLYNNSSGDLVDSKSQLKFLSRRRPAPVEKEERSKASLVKNAVKVPTLSSPAIDYIYKGFPTPINWWVYYWYLLTKGLTPKLVKVLRDTVAFEHTSIFFNEDVETSQAWRVKELMRKIHALADRSAIFVKRVNNPSGPLLYIQPIKSLIWHGPTLFEHGRKAWIIDQYVHEYEMYMRLHPIGWGSSSSLYNLDYKSPLAVIYQSDDIKMDSDFWKTSRPVWYFKRNKYYRALTYLRRHPHRKLKYFNHLVTLHLRKKGIFNLQKIYKQKPLSFYNFTRYEGFLSVVYFRVMQLLRLFGTFPFFSYFVIIRFILQLFVRLNGILVINVNKVTCLFDLLELSYFGLFIYMGLYICPLSNRSVYRHLVSDIEERQFRFQHLFNRSRMAVQNILDRGVKRVMFGNLVGKMKRWMFRSVRLLLRSFKLVWKNVKMVLFRGLSLFTFKLQRFLKGLKTWLLFSKKCLSILLFQLHILRRHRTRVMLPLGLDSSILDLLFSFKGEEQVKNKQFK